MLHAVIGAFGILLALAPEGQAGGAPVARPDDAGGATSEAVPTSPHAFFRLDISGGQMATRGVGEWSSRVGWSEGTLLLGLHYGLLILPSTSLSIHHFIWLTSGFEALLFPGWGVGPSLTQYLPAGVSATVSLGLLLANPGGDVLSGWGGQAAVGWDGYRSKEWSAGLICQLTWLRSRVYCEVINQYCQVTQKLFSVGLSATFH